MRPKSWSGAPLFNQKNKSILSALANLLLIRLNYCSKRLCENQIGGHVGSRSDCELIGP